MVRGLDQPDAGRAACPFERRLHHRTADAAVLGGGVHRDRSDPGNLTPLVDERASLHLAVPFSHEAHDVVMGEQIAHQVVAELG